MSREKVICTEASEPPVVVWNGLTKSVHTYCGLEIAIMAISPRPS